MQEDADRLAEALPELPELEAGARLLLPPTPILKEDNWPLLTVSKGFFENLATGAHTGRTACDENSSRQAGRQAGRHERHETCGVC